MRTEPTYAWRWLFRLVVNPYSAFLFYLCGVAAFMLVPRSPEFGLAYTLLGPWFAIVLLFLTLPFVAAAFRKLRMTEAQKRNHALEHGTIFFLHECYGKKARIGGRAFDSGFRLSGIKDKADIPEAFAKLLQALQEGHTDCAVANRCGSMIVAAQGLAVSLLTATWLLAACFHFALSVSAILLAANLCLFLILRYPLGHWLQRRFLLSLDFNGAEILSIKPVKKRVFYERPSVFFVKTKMMERTHGTH